MKSKDILPESERQNIVNQVIVFDKLLEAIMACEEENEELREIIESKNAEIERLKKLARELPSDCILDLDDVKFCQYRNGDGGKCKWCL